MNKIRIFIKFLIVILFSLQILSCSKKADIPFSELEPFWTSWESYNHEGESGMFCKKQNDMVVSGLARGTMNVISFDSNGMQVPPTKPGSKLFFETDRCIFVWVNGINIETQGKLVFKITKEGLFYDSGKGSIKFKNGRSMKF